MWYVLSIYFFCSQLGCSCEPGPCCSPSPTTRRKSTHLLALLTHSPRQQSAVSTYLYPYRSSSKMAFARMVVILLCRIEATWVSTFGRVIRTLEDLVAKQFLLLLCHILRDLRGLHLKWACGAAIFPNSLGLLNELAFLSLVGLVHCEAILRNLLRRLSVSRCRCLDAAFASCLRAHCSPADPSWDMLLLIRSTMAMRMKHAIREASLCGTFAL